MLEAAYGLGQSAQELRRTESELTRLLADTAGTLGWRGEAAQVAEARQVRHGSQLDQTAEALTRAASALSELEGLLRAGSRRLVDLRERREDLVRLPSDESGAALLRARLGALSPDGGRW